MGRGGRGGVKDFFKGWGRGGNQYLLRTILIKQILKAYGNHAIVFQKYDIEIFLQYFDDTLFSGYRSG